MTFHDFSIYLEDTKLKTSDSYCISQPFSYKLALRVYVLMCAHTRFQLDPFVVVEDNPEDSSKPDTMASSKAKAKAKGKAAPRSKALTSMLRSPQKSEDLQRNRSFC